MTIDAPLKLHSETILPGWIDYNGHMNVAYYVLVFDHATDAFLDYIGLTDSHRTQHQSSTFAAELHVNYLREVREGDEVEVTTQLLGYDEKRFHYFHQMYHKGEGWLSASNEVMSLHMDMAVRRVAPMPANIIEKLTEISNAHDKLPLPENVGRKMAIKSRARQES